jgi:hypothetical protein
MKKIFNALIFFLLFLWQLPQNIVALIMMLFLGKLKLVKYDKYCFAFQAKKMSGAISLGNFIFLSPYSAKRDTTVAHEYGHVVDSQRMGFAYLFVIGLPSILNAWFRFTECYYDWFTEKRANKHAGLGVDSLCRLYYIDKPDYNKKK